MVDPGFIRVSHLPDPSQSAHTSVWISPQNGCHYDILLEHQHYDALGDSIKHNIVVDNIVPFFTRSGIAHVILDKHVCDLRIKLRSTVNQYIYTNKLFLSFIAGHLCRTPQQLSQLEQHSPDFVKHLEYPSHPTQPIAEQCAFLFLRRRRKGAGAGPLAQFSEEKPPQHPPLGLGASASFPYIPHPADDETVRARILTLFDHASLHVDNYYSSGVAAASNLHDSATPLSSYESPYLPATITTLLAKPGRQRAVLTHVLVRELLQQITPGPAKGKLLPACYASCPQVVDQTPETDHALFSWRMLTAYLYRHQQATRDADEHAIDRLTERFVDTFTGYANSAHTRSERLQHLKSVASAAADLGRWLFAQPCAFEFVWDYAGRQGVVITPRVVKVCDEQGRRLSVPQVMAEGTSL
ncbi:uncharacterized protein CDV56_108745 [Aspergillus thermomutatus]|uniref:Uncharacterized protein n=1 Tax=Aspergillus thermomutatus TaxID=41047 RepID=A0A397HPK1_ASPTH|nr:uncharacterized protein CDV56_108745 [Aspergillus thermomutatus]RHZ63244.1 hypothetical protein CDV56_108745 [Aspergillus thermomutatus]